MPTNDLAGAINWFLKTDELAQPVRDLLVRGEDSVLKAGEVSPDILTEMEKERRLQVVSSLGPRALCLSTQDGGDDPEELMDVYTETAIVRIYDRFQLDLGLRSVGDVLIHLLRRYQHRMNFASYADRGLLKIMYGGRVGHRYDASYAVDFESIMFTARITLAEVD